MNEEAEIKQILETSRVIAIVGLSPKTHRASYDVAAYLQQAGYRIIPVNPSNAGKTILDEVCYASLEQAAGKLAEEKLKIEIVNCFRKSEDILPIAESAVNIHAACLWMQLGIQNHDAAVLAEKAGLTVVMNRCIKIEHRRNGSSVR